ncbi:MAG: hypothetical protein ACK5Z5_08760 [Neisseriaceae bacterium]
MEKNASLDNISTVINSQITEDTHITKKISFKRETLRDLATLAEREYFDNKMKQDDKLSNMLDKIISEYYHRWLLSSSQKTK